MAGWRAQRRCSSGALSHDESSRWTLLNYIFLQSSNPKGHQTPSAPCTEDEWKKEPEPEPKSCCNTDISLSAVFVCVRLRSCAFLHTRVWFSATCNRWTFSCFAVYSNRKSCHLMMFSENLRRKKIIPSNMRIHLRCDLNKSQVSYYFRRFCPFYCHAETFSIHNFLFRSTRLESWL